MTLELTYYQFNQHFKRLIGATIIYDAFDKNQSNPGYDFNELDLFSEAEAHAGFRLYMSWRMRMILHST